MHGNRLKPAPGTRMPAWRPYGVRGWGGVRGSGSTRAVARPSRRLLQCPRVAAPDQVRRKCAAVQASLGEGNAPHGSTPLQRAVPPAELLIIKAVAPCQPQRVCACPGSARRRRTGEGHWRCGCRNGSGGQHAHGVPQQRHLGLCGKGRRCALGLRIDACSELRD